MDSSILKTNNKGTFRINNRPMDSIINFCSWRFFIFIGWNYKYMKKAVLQSEALPFTIIN